MSKDLIGHTELVNAAVFSLDGRRLVTASQDRTIKLWDTETYQEVFTLRGHTAGVVRWRSAPTARESLRGGVDRTARSPGTPIPADCREPSTAATAADRVEALYDRILGYRDRRSGRCRPTPRSPSRCARPPWRSRRGTGSRRTLRPPASSVPVQAKIAGRKPWPRRPPTAEALQAFLTVQGLRPLDVPLVSRQPRLGASACKQRALDPPAASGDLERGGRSRASSGPRVRRGPTGSERTCSGMACSIDAAMWNPGRCFRSLTASGTREPGTPSRHRALRAFRPRWPSGISWPPPSRTTRATSSASGWTGSPRYEKLTALLRAMGRPPSAALASAAESPGRRGRPAVDSARRPTILPG